MNILLNFVIFIHTIFVIFVVITPFIGSNYFLLLHTLFVPFMMLHWLLNNNICFLTAVEKKIRKQIDKNFDESYCFTCQIIEPIYDFKKNNEEYSLFLYLLSSLLWFITIYKLYNRYSTGQITNIKDLFS